PVVTRTATGHGEDLTVVELVLVRLLPLPRQIFGGAHGLGRGCVRHQIDSSPGSGMGPPHPRRLGPRTHAACDPVLSSQQMLPLVPMLTAAWLAANPPVPGPGEISRDFGDTSIYGGEQSDPGEWPAVVAVSTGKLCTGTLVAPDLVLT